MNTIRTNRAVAVVVVALPIFVGGGAAEAQQVDEQTGQCVDAYQTAQELRLDGKLRAAREKASFCAQEGCPNAVRSGCTKWLAELIDAQPSIALTARGADDTDISDVRVFIDGVMVADSLTGRAIDLDPGRHVLRVIHGDFPPQDQEIIISEGVKSRPITVRFGSQASAAPPDPRRAVAGPTSEPSIVGPVVVGLAGVASLGAFGVLAALGSAELEDMRQTCGVTHTCPQGRIDQAKTQLVVGDVFLATGVVGVGAAIAWYIGGRASAAPPAAPLEVSVHPDTRGASTKVRLRF